MSTTPSPTSDRTEPETGTYTIAEVAEKLKCSERHVHRQVALNNIPGVIHIGKLCRFKKTVIDRWLTRG